MAAHLPGSQDSDSADAPVQQDAAICEAPSDDTDICDAGASKAVLEQTVAATSPGPPTEAERVTHSSTSSVEGIEAAGDHIADIEVDQRSESKDAAASHADRHGALQHAAKGDTGAAHDQGSDDSFDDEDNFGDFSGFGAAATAPDPRTSSGARNEASVEASEASMSTSTPGAAPDVADRAAHALGSDASGHARRDPGSLEPRSAPSPPSEATSDDDFGDFGGASVPAPPLEPQAAAAPTTAPPKAAAAPAAPSGKTLEDFLAVLARSGPSADEGPDLAAIPSAAELAAQAKLDVQHSVLPATDGVSAWRNSPVRSRFLESVGLQELAAEAERNPDGFQQQDGLVVTYPTAAASRSFMALATSSSSPMNGDRPSLPERQQQQDACSPRKTQSMLLSEDSDPFAAAKPSNAPSTPPAAEGAPGRQYVDLKAVETTSAVMMEPLNIVDDFVPRSQAAAGAGTPAASRAPVQCARAAGAAGQRASIFKSLMLKMPDLSYLTVNKILYPKR